MVTLRGGHCHPDGGRETGEPSRTKDVAQGSHSFPLATAEAAGVSACSQGAGAGRGAEVSQGDEGAGLGEKGLLKLIPAVLQACVSLTPFKGALTDVTHIKLLPMVKQRFKHCPYIEFNPYTNTVGQVLSSLSFYT